MFDLHTHTVASGHYTTDTLTKLIAAAHKRGLTALGVSEHAPAMAGACRESYFLALRSMPRVRMGQELLYGAELNILDDQGRVDLSAEVLEGLDYTIASLHPPIFPCRDEKYTTDAYIGAMRSPYINVIGHPDDQKYPLQLDRFLSAAKETGTLPELNNSSLTNGYRGDTVRFNLELLACCKERSIPILLGSDSHGAAHVGDVSACLKLVEQTAFPRELILNYDLPAFRKLVAQKRTGSAKF